MDFAPMPHSMKALIFKSEDLTPQTTWQETKWAWTSEEELAVALYAGPLFKKK